MSKYALLNYDVPTRTNYSPRRRLRRLALYLSQSCCLIRNDRRPHHVIAELARVGATYHIADFDDSATDGLEQFALEQIRSDVAAAARRLADAIAAGPADETPEAAAAYQRRVRAAVTRHRNLISDYAAAVAEFGLSCNFTAALESLRRMDARANEQARAYVRAASTLPADDPIRLASEGDLVPAEILADYTMDHGDEPAGVELAGVV